MKTFTKTVALIMPLSVLAACASTPEPEVVEITPPPIVQTCYPIASLQKVVVPAVTKSGFSIVSIESPDQYIYDETTGKTIVVKSPPIETKTPYTKIVTPEKIYYTTETGEVITDICEVNASTISAPPAPTQ